MVKVNKTRGKSPSWTSYLPAVALVAIMIVLASRFMEDGHVVASSSSLARLEPNNADAKSVASVERKETEIAGESNKSINNNKFQCPYSSIDDLTEEERHPKAGPRHMVSPPAGGPLSLVCCQTTKGVFNTLVHENWAPNGAQRFLEMVRSNYFDSQVPLMRCVKNFICQFGLNSDPLLSKQYRPTLKDDPNWLPEGKDHRKNDQGVLRFAHGYMAYAGGGLHSRNNQFIISLKDVPTLAGGSPWEVPWGEIVGSHSFETWSKVYTGYGEKGPPQGKLMNRGMPEELRQEFPDLDYITGCNIVDQRNDG